MNNSVSLDILEVGQYGKVLSLENSGTIRRRLLDIGLTENSVVKCIGKSPWGDPCAYLIRGAIIALRKEDSKKVKISILFRGDENGID